jgi:hypothetical protein
VRFETRTSSPTKGTVTLIVSKLEDDRRRIAMLKPGEIERADYVNLIRLRDPDKNLVVLAEQRKG